MHAPSPAKSSPAVKWGKVALVLALNLSSGFQSIWEWCFPYLWTRVSLLCLFTKEKSRGLTISQESWSAAVQQYKNTSEVTLVCLSEV